MTAQRVRFRHTPAGQPRRIEAEIPVAIGKAGAAEIGGALGSVRRRRMAGGFTAPRERSRWSLWTARDSVVARALPASRWDWDASAWRAARMEELGWLAEAAEGARAGKR
jgi:hypothetical protein